MTDDVKETELDDETSTSAEPDFSPAAAAPLIDDDITDDDPHASFDPIAAIAEDPHLDPYGVGAPKSTDEDYLDEEDEEVDSFDTNDSEAY